MDLSPRCKMIIMLMYFRFLPGITVCRLAGCSFGKVVRKTQDMRCGYRKNNKGLREISLKFFNAGVKLH